MREIQVTEKQAIRFSNGGELDLGRIKYDEFCHDEIYRVYFNDKFLGLGKSDTEKNILKIECLVDRQV